MPSPKVEVNLEVCALDLLLDVIGNGRTEELQYIAGNLPRPVPPKRRKDRRSLQRALVSQWAYENSRAAMIGMLSNMVQKFFSLAAQEDGVAQLRDAKFFWNAIAWAIHRNGGDASKFINKLPAKERREFSDRQESLLNLVHALDEQRKLKQSAGGDALHRAATKEAKRRTKTLSWQIEDLSRKHVHAQEAVGSVARQYETQIAELQAELQTAHERNESLEMETAALREEIVRLTRRSPEGSSGEVARTSVLTSKRVLVIGDDSRQVAYREIIGKLGSEFDFVSGFTQPRAVEQRLPWADVVVLVTTYMSHKVSGVITSSGKPIVWVNSAGERSFREAVEKYLIQDSAGQ